MSYRVSLSLVGLGWPWFCNHHSQLDRLVMVGFTDSPWALLCILGLHWGESGDWPLTLPTGSFNFQESSLVLHNAIVKEKTTSFKMSLVLKPRIINLNLVPDLLAVLTYPEMSTSCEFFGQHQWSHLSHGSSPSPSTPYLQKKMTFAW